MRVETWTKGSVPKLDLLFDQLREQQYQDRSHRLWQNYSKTSFEHAGIIACTIYFDDDDLPEMCSSISSRDCWPNDAYRILNRTWKHSNKVVHSVKISKAMVSNVRSQIEWLEKFTDYKLYFISRQTDNWMEWVAGKFKSQYDLDFTIAPNKYLTCPNECDETCWQRVIYTGDEQLLDNWKSK
jgi:hypothetical protein